MSGQQAYIYNKDNKLLDAAIAASVSPSAKAALIYPVTKKGNGNISVRGNFSGPVDATYEVKVADSAFSAPVISVPVFKGAGTGQIKDIAASGLDAQKVRVLCLSTGVRTQTAEIEIEGVRFRAKESGAAGNNITITVDDSTLVFSDSTFSAIKDLKEADTALEGQEWDWDTKILQGDIVPDSAHRVAFGPDTLHIYRQYKKFENGVYKYYFIMPIRYPVLAGTKVFFVTGGRTITVSDGETSEEYTDIVTIADFWAAVRSVSALIEPVDNALNTEKTADSPAVREMVVKTSSYSLPPYGGEKSSEYASELESIKVNLNTKTELVQAKCKDNTFVGAEIWEVSGSSSGYLGQVKTGDYNEFGPIGFTIPQKFPDDWGVIKEDWSWKATYMSRGQGITPPPICLAMRLGINAKPQSLRLEYKKRPVACVCPPVSFSDAYLGFDEKGGEIGMAYTVPDLTFWTEAAAERMCEVFRRGQTQKSGEGEATKGRESVQGQYTFQNFARMTAEYFRRWKSLAQRIMALPEDDADALAQMVTDYKALINSLSLWAYNQGTPITATWSDITGVWSDSTLLTIDEVRYDTAKYKALVDSVLEYEKTYGVKKNSVISSDDGSYQDSDSEYYWEVRGNKAYLPAFTDVPYYSTVKSGDSYINTKEFAFDISVPCGGSLLEGDIIEITIGGIEYEHTYKNGDIIFLPTVAAQNLSLSGGIDGDDTYTFEVKGDIDSFPDYLLDRNDPQPYSGTKLSFMIDDGIIMFAVGDMFEFNIEGGHWIFRKDGGGWSELKEISPDFQSLGDDLEIAFGFGVSPSFMVDDLWEILCTQENRAANLSEPWDTLYKGDGNLVFAFSAATTVDTLIIDAHDMSGTISFQASDQEDFGELIADVQIAVSPLICKFWLDAPITAKYFRIVKNTENEIGYVFLGRAARLSVDADSVVPFTKYNMLRQQDGRFSLFRAISRGYMVKYDSFVNQSDHEILDDLINYQKTNNDMPFYFSPNVKYPEEALRGIVDADNIEPGSDKDMNMDKDKRIYTWTLPIVGV